jgi:hypothetical protein
VRKPNGFYGESGVAVEREPNHTLSRYPMYGRFLYF